MSTAASGGPATASTDAPSAGPSGAAPAGAMQAEASPNAHQQMAEVLNELRQVGGLEPADYDQLIRDMQKTDPSLWPLLVQQVRATVAYRERMLAKAGPTHPSSALAQHGPANRPPAHGDTPTDAMNNAWPAPTTAPQQGPQRLPPVEQSPVETMAGRLRLPGGSGERSRAYETMQPADESATIAPNGAEHEARRPAPPDMRRAELKRDAMVRPVSHLEESLPEETDPAPRAVSSQSETRAGQRRAPQPDQATASRSDGPPDELPIAEEDRAPEGKRSQKSTDVSKRSDWRESLAAAIRDLERQTASAQGTAADAAQLARLRLLYLAAGQREAALRPAPALPAAQQEFLSKTLYGWDAWLDAERTPDPALRAAEAKRALEEAADRLADAAPLVVRNLAFCTEILSYGSHKPFRTNEFSPDQEVLLYVEVENFSSESTARGFHTALRSSYQIFDSRGQRVAEHDFTLTEEHCQNQRRDFFIGYHLRIPKRIYPGKYTLQLTVEDTKSRKVGQSQIDFTVKDAPSAAK